MTENSVGYFEQKEKTGFRIGLIVSAVIALAVGIWSAIDIDLLAGLAFGYMVFAFGTHIGHDCLVDDVFIGAWTKTIHMPGIIFELDLDSILFMLAYRFLIAPIVSLVLMIGFGIFGTLLAMLIAVFTFPFNIYGFIKEMV